MRLHEPVLYREVLELLAPVPGGRYVDCTLGDGGHALGVIERSAPDGLLLGLDRDPRGLVRAGERLTEHRARCTLLCRPASALNEALAEVGWPAVDGVMLDLGLSSPQLEHAERGFSLQHDGPLDMRFDQCQPLTADALVNGADERALADILFRFGEERASRRVARAIVRARPLRGTLHLAEVVERALGGRRGRPTHPATRTFQALRIAVNDELAEVEGAVAAALEAVKPGGAITVLSFHSLEDRAVKAAFAEVTGQRSERDPYGNPLRPAIFRTLTRRAIKGSELDPNPRARSAHLRAVQRLPESAHLPTAPHSAPR
ncbi:MAG: 16S rRNA (cytosine(1402)-N(4))-methyltransferase RsmH [Pseudomonadota bacterium]